MLVPGVGGLATDQNMHSFVAALDLGLRRKFGGEIGHLRTMECEYPISGTNRRRKYLLLYDTVPGGTGYLKDRMTDLDKLRSIFEAAHAALRECGCVQDPEKDGCYRCVFAYRRSRDMPTTSRKVAERLVAATLKRWSELEVVEGLTGVADNVLTESELEERFVEALRQRAADSSVEMRSTQVRGKPGYSLSVGGNKYLVEPQADFDMGDGVAVPSRPDFAIWPDSGRDAEVSEGAGLPRDAPAVAVFLDGFEYHRDQTGDDSAKRMSLTRAGLLVWSLTWDDLEGAFGGVPRAPNFLADHGAAQTAVQTALDQCWDTRELRQRLSAPSFDLLLHYLANPDPAKWRRAVFVEVLGVFDQQQMTSPALRARFDDAASDALPGQVLEAVADLARPVVVGGFGPWASGRSAASLFAALPLVAVQAPDPASVVVAVHFDDENTDVAADAQQYRSDWNGVLRLFNILQFLPQAWWTTRTGVSAGLYPELAPTDANDAHHVQDAELGQDDAHRFVAPQLRPLLRQLARRDLPAPEPGHELADDAGKVVAHSELAWPSQRVVLLLPNQEHHKMLYERSGWHVLTVKPDEPTGALVDTIAQALSPAPHRP